MKTRIVENVIAEIEDFLDDDVDPNANQLEKWAYALREALEEEME